MQKSFLKQEREIPLRMQKDDTACIKFHIEVVAVVTATGQGQAEMSALYKTKGW